MEVITMHKRIQVPDSVFQTPSINIAWDRLCRVHTNIHNENARRGLLLYGPSGRGKTYLLEEYQQCFPAEVTPERIVEPVFYYRFKESKKTVDDFLVMLIRAMGNTPPSGKLMAGELFHMFTTLLRQKQVEVLMLDEIQQVLPKSDGQKALDMVKFLCALVDSKEISCAIVLAGSERAMRLLNFGKTDKTVDDNEQFSRRMMRPVRIDAIEAQTQMWVDCVNFFMRKIGFPELTPENDSELFDRIFLAYVERQFGTLQNLFLLEDMSCIQDKCELIERLKLNFELYGKSAINPFCEKQLPAAAVSDAIEQYFATLRMQLAQTPTARWEVSDAICY